MCVCVCVLGLQLVRFVGMCLSACDSAYKVPLSTCEAMESTGGCQEGALSHTTAPPVSSSGGAQAGEMDEAGQGEEQYGDEDAPGPRDSVTCAQGSSRGVC